MLVAIHQPHYMPWLRYIDKIARSDVFVLLDDVQYEKNGWQNRNRIKTAQGWSYLTVPVLRPTQCSLVDIRIDPAAGWRSKHRRALELNYRRAPHFDRYWPEIAVLYDREWTSLVELNETLLRLLLRQLALPVRMVRSSTLGVEGHSTQRLVGICRALGATAYLSGACAVNSYLDPAIMADHGIRVVCQEWKAPVYSQLYPGAGFIPDLAVIDLLFNLGPRAAATLRPGPIPEGKAAVGAVAPAEATVAVA